MVRKARERITDMSKAERDAFDMAISGFHYASLPVELQQTVRLRGSVRKDRQFIFTAPVRNKHLAKTFRRTKER